MDSIPELHPKPPGVGLRTLGLFLPGVKRVSDQIPPYTRWWSDRNQEALTATGPLLAVIGDSTAIGIGASSPDRGFVGRLRDALNARDGRAGDGHSQGEQTEDEAVGDGGSTIDAGGRGTDGVWRVINLAQSGARVADGIERQLPIVQQLMTRPETRPTIVLSLLGSNDVFWSRETTVLRGRLRELIQQLPNESLVGLVAGGSPRTMLANRAIKTTAGEHGHRIINPWNEPGPPPGARLSEDKFHPNDVGYTLMSRPFARAVGAPEPATPIDLSEEPAN